MRELAQLRNGARELDGQGIHFARAKQRFECRLFRSYRFERRAMLGLGSLWGWLTALLWGREMEVVICGLSASGKTTYLTYLRHGAFVQDVVPTLSVPRPVAARTELMSYCSRCPLSPCTRALQRIQREKGQDGTDYAADLGSLGSREVPHFLDSVLSASALDCPTDASSRA